MLQVNSVSAQDVRARVAALVPRPPHTVSLVTSQARLPTARLRNGAADTAETAGLVTSCIRHT